MHPTWNSSWGGHLKFKNCNIEKIEPKPNRFIWIDPSTLHDVTSTSETITHARVANIAFLGGEMYVDPVGTDFINILTSD